LSERADEVELADAELVAEDDAVIGRAFKLSLFVAGAAAAVIVAAIWIAKLSVKAPETRPIENAPPVAARSDARPPAVAFTDVSEGIGFTHVSGAHGQKLLPETMGGGVAFLDFDGDGDADLLFVNSCHWPGHEPAGAPAPTMALYANDGQGRFSDVTRAAGLDVTFYGMGVAVGDADCDGDPDLVFTAVGPARFFRNDGGRFTQADVGLRGAEDDWSTCATFFDSDGDGDLDLFVGRYVRWSPEIDLAVDFRLTGIGRAYGPPTNFAGTHSLLYENDGGGRFSDVSELAGLVVLNPATQAPMGKALGVMALDADDDGDCDLFVANDTVQNHFFRNRGDGTFEEVGAELGVAFDRNGAATGAMGIDACFYDERCTLAFAIGNFANEMTSFYVAQRGGELFADEAITSGIGAPSRQRLSFGVAFLDYDLDGRPDLLQANGHIEGEINVVQPSQRHEQPAQLFWNAGPASRTTFVEVADAGDLSRPIVGRGAAYADVDGDGDVDVLLTQAGGAPLLLRNDQALGHHWLRLRIQGDGCNRDAIGARVEVTAGGRTQRAVVQPSRGYLSSVELPLTFGLGPATEVERVRVRWADGREREWTGLEVDRLHVLGPR
jgi:hypothetical protein